MINKGQAVIQIIRPIDEELNRLDENNYLARFANNIFSQGGEDGVIQEILKILNFKKRGWCVEFGACDGQRDSNTWNLVKNKGWKAVYIESDPQFFEYLQKNCNEIAGTWCFNDFVGWEGESSLDSILSRTPIPIEFELLVIDIDGPDYYVWEAFEHYKPHIVCIEFHRLINPTIPYVHPYKHASLNHPSSLFSLCELGKRKGYELVCVINWNAFFVKKEHFSKFNIKNNRPESMYYPYEEMRIFQGYDGTLLLCGNDLHYWKYQINEAGITTNIKISQRDIQVLPDGLRVFRPCHTYSCKILENQAGKLDNTLVPGNVLLQYRQTVTSENGEDGILEHIFNVIGICNKVCVDVGACDGFKWSNVWNLIINKGWQGLLIEKDPMVFKDLIGTYQNVKNVKCINSSVGGDGKKLEELLFEYKIPLDLDLLTIDVEGIDYYIFESLTEYTPRVIVIDFNPSISNDILFVQEDNDRIHYGASLSALVHLAKSKGYELASVTDWNAIFVLSNLFSALEIKNNKIDMMYKPPFEMRMFQSLDGCLHLCGFSTLVRQDYVIEWEDLQVLPRQLRGRANSFEDFGQLKSIFYAK